MILAILFCGLTLSPPRYADGQADALVLFYIEAPVPIPDDLPIEVGDALVRLWEREELWQRIAPSCGPRLRSDIEWTRDNRQPLPALAELARLPSNAEAERARLILYAMRDNLDQIAGVVPEWNALAIVIQRAEIDECLCFWDELATARSENLPPICRRHALRRIRETRGDEAWFAGEWPFVPWWRFPRQP